MRMRYSEIIPALVRKAALQSGMKEGDLNDGRCRAFAADLEVKYPDEFEYQEDSERDHAWVRSKTTNLYYDAQCPEGVASPYELPFFNPA